MFKQCVYEIDSDAWPNRSVVCSVSVANVSAGTSTASEDSFRTSNFLQSHDNRPLTCKSFS